MKEITVQDWKGFQDALVEIRQMREDIRKQHPYCKHPDLLFRGQQDATWQLETTLERWIRNDRRLPTDVPAPFPAEDYLQMIYGIKPEIEAQLGNHWPAPEYSEALNTLRRDLERLPPPLCELMACLRHLNFPSPLLDWTTSPYVAAHFAFKTVAHSVNQVAVYAYIEPVGDLDFRRVDLARIGSVGPTINAHVRHFSQQSQYTYCRKKCTRDSNDGDWFYVSHEEAFGTMGEHRSDYLWKIIIPATERKFILGYLQQHNVTGFSLFHSPESLMESLAIRELTLGRRSDTGE